MKFATAFVVASIITSAIAAPAPDLDKRDPRNPFSRRRKGSNSGISSNDSPARKGIFGTSEDMQRLKGKVIAGAVGGVGFGVAGVAIAKALEPKQDNSASGGAAEGNLRPLNANQLEKRGTSRWTQIIAGSMVQGFVFGTTFAAVNEIVRKIEEPQHKKELKKQQEGLKRVSR